MMKEQTSFACLGFANSTVHARWLHVHEGYRLPLFVFALLLNTQVAEGLDVLLLGFKLLLQNTQK